MQLMAACERLTELRRRNANGLTCPTHKSTNPAPQSTQPSPAKHPAQLSSAQPRNATTEPHPQKNAKAGCGSRGPQWAPIRTPLASNEGARALLGEQLLDALDAFEQGVIAESVAEAQVA